MKNKVERCKDGAVASGAYFISAQYRGFLRKIADISRLFMEHHHISEIFKIKQLTIGNFD